jgi:hypothetical protein
MMKNAITKYMNESRYPCAAMDIILSLAISKCSRSEDPA